MNIDQESGKRRGIYLVLLSAQVIGAGFIIQATLPSADHTADVARLRREKGVCARSAAF
jgi:hypothetical protein